MVISSQENDKIEESLFFLFSMFAQDASEEELVQVYAETPEFEQAYKAWLSNQAKNLPKGE